MDNNCALVDQIHDDCSLVLASCLHNAQDVDEEVDEVQVQTDRSHDVLFRGELVHDDVCIKYDEATEQQGTPNGDDKLQGLTPEKYLCN